MAKLARRRPALFAEQAATATQASMMQAVCLGASFSGIAHLKASLVRDLGRRPRLLVEGDLVGERHLDGRARRRRHDGRVRGNGSDDGEHDQGMRGGLITDFDLFSRQR